MTGWKKHKFIPPIHVFECVGKLVVFVQFHIACAKSSAFPCFWEHILAYFDLTVFELISRNELFLGPVYDFLIVLLKKENLTTKVERSISTSRFLKVQIPNLGVQNRQVFRATLLRSIAQGKAFRRTLSTLSTHGKNYLGKIASQNRNALLLNKWWAGRTTVSPFTTTHAM
jgi:hypothetical protein